MVNEKTKKIYLVVSQTGTILSRIVKMVTRDKYNHVSVSLMENVEEIYSFGRKRPYNPFDGGFVRESPAYGTFERFKNTEAVILEVPVTEETYTSMKKELDYMYEHRDEYFYNTIGLLIAYFGKRRIKKNSYYCSEFIQVFLSKYGMGLKKPDRELVCPNDFVNVPGGHIIFTGKLRDYYLAKKAEEAALAPEEKTKVTANV